MLRINYSFGETVTVGGLASPSTNMDVIFRRLRWLCVITTFVVPFFFLSFVLSSPFPSLFF